jgi:hypothetical protein
VVVASKILVYATGLASDTIAFHRVWSGPHHMERTVAQQIKAYLLPAGGNEIARSPRDKVLTVPCCSASQGPEGLNGLQGFRAFRGEFLCLVFRPVLTIVRAKFSTAAFSRGRFSILILLFFLSNLCAM